METQRQSKSNSVLAGIVWVASPLVLGLLSSLIAGDEMNKFDRFNKPPLAPAAWLFPIAWTILYILMGLAACFIYLKHPKTQEEKSARSSALWYFCAQLLLNIVWTPLFFLGGFHWIALICLLVMWILIIATMSSARKVSQLAFWLLLPYLLWCTFAAYLNAGIAILN